MSSWSRRSPTTSSIYHSSSTRRSRMCCSQSLRSSSSLLSRSKMDPLYPDHDANKTYSHNPRSRDDSRAPPPTTEALFQSLRLADSSSAGTTSFDTSSFTSSRPPSARGLASPAFQSPNLPHSTSFLHSQPPRHHSAYNPSSYHHPPASLGSSSWFDTERQHQSQQPPLLRVEPAPEELQPPTSSPPLPSVETGAMR